jgi:hypothetical protein
MENLNGGSNVQGTQTISDNTLGEIIQNQDTSTEVNSRFSIKVIKKPVPATPRGVLAE